MDNPKVTTPPELEIEPAGEANTTAPTALPINDAVEPPQTESVQPPTEPVPAPETSQTEPLSEALEPAPKTPTPHLPVDEALAETVPEYVPQGAGAVAEAPMVENPIPPPTPIPSTSPSEETPPKAEESPRTPQQTPSQTQITPQPEPAQTPPPQTQQGTAQPEPARIQESPASPPESVPAQAQEIATPPRNILMLLLTKAHLVTQLRKQKKLIKVMGMFAAKKSITNDDVEKLLHVSDATALRYLTHLKKENKIIQNGRTGQGVTYTKR